MTEICAPLDGLHAFAEVPGSQRSGTDALLLAGFASPRKGDVAAELGCGAGAVPLLFCLHREFARFYAVERLPELARLARRNLEENGFSHRVAVLEGDARAISLPEKADLVCMNPPYLKSQGKAPADPLRRAARREEAGTVFELCRAAAGWLKEKGTLCAVYRPERLADLLEALRRAGVEPKELLPVQDRPGRDPSLILVRGVKGAKPALVLRRPFLLREADGSDTPEARLLYEKGIIEHEA